MFAIVYISLPLTAGLQLRHLPTFSDSRVPLEKCDNVLAGQVELVATADIISVLSRSFGSGLLY